MATQSQSITASNYIPDEGYALQKGQKPLSVPVSYWSKQILNILISVRHTRDVNCDFLHVLSTVISEMMMGLELNSFYRGLFSYQNREGIFYSQDELC